MSRGGVSAQGDSHGWLTPHGGIIRSAARSGGTIEAILVQEGQVVRAGETLAALRLSLDTQEGDAGVALERSVRAEMGATDLGALVQVQKLRAEAAQLAERQRLLQSQRAELLANIATLSDIQSVAKDDYNRGTGLRDKGFMAQSALDQKKTALLVAQHDLSSGRNSLNAVDQQLAQVRSEIHAMPLLLAQAESQGRSNSAALQQKLEQARAQSRYTLTAPIDGKVMAVPVEIGQTLTAGATVIGDNARLDALGSRAVGSFPIGGIR